MSVTVMGGILACRNWPNQWVSGGQPYPGTLDRRANHPAASVPKAMELLRQEQLFKPTVKSPRLIGTGNIRDRAACGRAHPRLPRREAESGRGAASGGRLCRGRADRGSAV